MRFLFLHDNNKAHDSELQAHCSEYNEKDADNKSV